MLALHLMAPILPGELLRVALDLLLFRESGCVGGIT